MHTTRRPPTPALLAALVAACGVLASPAAIAQPERCPGTKEWYGGKCRYPDDVAKMRAEEAARRGAEQRRAAEQEARRRAERDAAGRAEEERRVAERRAASDRYLCEQARKADAVVAWQAYLDGFP